jgi:hypothetical protein
MVEKVSAAWCWKILTFSQRYHGMAASLLKHGLNCVGFDGQQDVTRSKNIE